MKAKTGQVVKIEWEDAPPDKWIIGKVSKGGKCAEMFNPRNGELRTINFDQILEVSELPP